MLIQAVSIKILQMFILNVLNKAHIYEQILFGFALVQLQENSVMQIEDGIHKLRTQTVVLILPLFESP